MKKYNRLEIEIVQIERIDVLTVSSLYDTKNDNDVSNVNGGWMSFIG